MQNQHKYTKNVNDTVTAVLTAGMDTDCGGFMAAKAMSGLLTSPAMEKLVDGALSHLFAVQFRLGFADPDSMVPWAKYVKSPEKPANT